MNSEQEAHLVKLARKERRHKHGLVIWEQDAPVRALQEQESHGFCSEGCGLIHDCPPLSPSWQTLGRDHQLVK
jgi:hypothetical protein